MPTTTTRVRAACAATLVSSILLSGCSGSDETAQSASTQSPSAASDATTKSGSPTTSTSPATTAKPSPSSTTNSTPCVDKLLASMTPAQRAGQLVMVGLSRGHAAQSLDLMISRQHIGNMFFIGGWSGRSTISSASAHVQGRATAAATKGVGFLIAADQEGGQVQQLRGPDFTRLPAALEQGRLTPAQRQKWGKTIGTELKSAGVNLDLAPVADTVPPQNPRSNEPIGRWGRQYGNTPDAAAAGVTDVVKGLQSTGVLATVKHFPGLGRITGNTDFTTSGIVDQQTTATDAYLKPFGSGIAAGARIVMVSSAYYAKIDPQNQAIFSTKVITDALRKNLQFNGIVISDDLNAVALRGTPVGQRAVRMIDAGGDIALTGLASQAPVMAQAVTAKYTADAGFRAKADASVKRVLTVKSAAGLTPCKPA